MEKMENYHKQICTSLQYAQNTPNYEVKRSNWIKEG